MADEDFPPLQLDPAIVVGDVARVLDDLAVYLRSLAGAGISDPVADLRWCAGRLAYVRGMAAQACCDLAEIEGQLLHAARWNARRPAPARVDF